MKRKWIAAIAVISISAFGLIGCNKEKDAAVEEVEVLTEEEIAAMEEEQNKIIAEYAAGVLMKYNAGTNSRVLEGQKLLAEEAKEEAIRAKEERRKQLYEEYAAEEEKQEQASSDNSGTKSRSQTSEEVINYISDMSGAINTPSFSIVYSGYEVTDSYGGNETFFAIDAKEGKSLLISKYLVTNTGGQAEELNILSKKIDFRLKMTNGTAKAQRTMLLDDLTTYRGSMEAGETKELIILFEISEDMLSDLGSMELVMENEGQRSRMPLEGGSMVVNTLSQEITEEVLESEGDFDITNEETEEVSEMQNNMEVETEEEPEVDASIITTVGSNNSIRIENAD